MPSKKLSRPQFAASDDSLSPYYFLHIPRTAGSTLNHVLDGLFNDFEICIHSGWTELLKTPRDTLNGYKIFRGNLYGYLHRYIDIPLRYFTFIRDPVERALSHYSNILCDENHWMRQRTIALGSFGAFIRDPEARNFVVNFQVRSIALDFDPVTHAAKLTEDEIGRLELERLHEPAQNEMSASQLFDVAKDRLQKMCFVGITEQFEQSLKLLCHTFHWPMPHEILSKNVNSERVTQNHIDVKDIKFLRQANAADYELYEFAKALFEKRMARARLYSPMFDSFVSYAQNYEDVMLNRALSGVERGFYIDVGAHDPIGDSVTRAFYERGWRGINIEPIPELCKRLRDDRPEDINLEVVASGKAGSLAFFDVPGTGLSTLKKNIAATHRRQGFKVRKINVAAKTLCQICDEAGVSEIHFLKIDVEGAEKDVLAGFDFVRHRPWIILIEATEPNSKNQNHQQWEPLLVSNGYEFVYFDGLNRFYVSHEHRDLTDAFRVPPNNFDRFVKYGDLLRERQLLELHANARKLKARDDFGPQAREADRIRTEYHAVCEARAVEQEEATKQIKELTAWASSADAYAKSVVEARALEHDEAIKQIRALTESTTSGVTYAKSLVVELDSSRLALQQEREARESERRRVELETAKTDQLAKLLDALHAERAASENEQLESKKRFLLLQTMLIAADGSNKFLSVGLANLSAEVHAERTSRKGREADSTKQMLVLGEQLSTTDANLKSQIMETERTSAELAAERAKRESQQIEAHHQNIELARKLSASVANVNASTVEIERLRQELTVERAKQVALRQHMEEQIRLLTENKGTASAHADMQAAQIDRLATELQDVHGKLEAGRKETVAKMQVLRARIKDLEVENNALRTELKTMRMEFHAARTGHNSELIALDGKLEAAQKDLSSYHEHWAFKALPRPKGS